LIFSQCMSQDINCNVAIAGARCGVRLALLGSRGSSKGSGSEDQIITPLGVGSLNSSPESKRFIDSRRYFLSIPPIPPAHFVFRIYILVFFLAVLLVVTQICADPALGLFNNPLPRERERPKLQFG